MLRTRARREDREQISEKCQNSEDVSQVLHTVLMLQMDSMTPYPTSDSQRPTSSFEYGVSPR